MHALLSNRQLFLLPRLAILSAVLALFGGLRPASAATDPDIDPATPIAVVLEDSGAGVLLTSAEVFLQQSAEGLPYLRLEYAVLNDGGEAVVSHALRIAVGEATAFASTGGELQPGEEQPFSYLIFGQAVSSLDPSTAEVLVTAVSSATSSTSGPDCEYARTRAECEVIAPSYNAFCNGDCIASGRTGGVPTCDRYRCYTDSRGVFCCDYSPSCKCYGYRSDTRRTITEGVFEGLVDPLDPLINPALDEPLEIEMRPWP